MADRKRELGTRGPQALAAAISATIAGTGHAVAQETAGLNEIIVTATKRAEPLQDIPESISAFDSDDIESRGLQGLDDYAKFVPGLSFGTREPGGTSIVFRGVASSGIQYGAVSSSGLYLDEQPISIAGLNPDPRLVDIERLEALRGPQGTLYGASSQSGTLRIITNKPDPEAFAASMDATLSQLDGGDTGYDLSGMVNIPLVTDTLALRLVGFSAEDAGYIDNVLGTSQGGTFDNSDHLDKNVNSGEYVGGRAALRWKINDDWTADLSGIFQNLDVDGFGDVNLDAGDLQQIRFENESASDDWYQVGLTLNARLPFGDAVLAASYFNRDFHYEADATDYQFAFNCPAYDANGDPNVGCVPAYTQYDFGGDPSAFATNDQTDKFTTLEARLASPSNSGSRWAWLVGAFYSQHERLSTFDSTIRGYETTPSFDLFNSLEPTYSGYDLAPTELWFVGNYDQDLDQVAIFGELSFDLTEHFTITAGGRWFDYDQRFALLQQSPQGSHAFNFLDDVTNSSESGFVSKFNLTYRFDSDRLVYATYSEGFRVGGSNPLKQSATLPRRYDSDQVNNYELGAKTEWLDNRFRFNIAAYYMEWDDFQAQVEDPTPIFNLGYVNFPSAEITGFESDFVVVATDQLQIEGALAYNNAEISETATQFGITVTDGTRLPLTPDWTASVGIEYRFVQQLLDAEPFARFDYAYVGDSVNSLEGAEAVVASAPAETQDSYDTGDVRFGLKTDTWTAALFVDNLWDERGEQFLSNRWAKQRLSLIRPRTYGVQFQYKFGE